MKGPLDLLPGFCKAVDGKNDLFIAIAKRLVLHNDGGYRRFGDHLEGIAAKHVLQTFLSMRAKHHDLGTEVGGCPMDLVEDAALKCEGFHDDTGVFPDIVGDITQLFGDGRNIEVSFLQL